MTQNLSGIYKNPKAQASSADRFVDGTEEQAPVSVALIWVYVLLSQAVLSVRCCAEVQQQGWCVFPAAFIGFLGKTPDSSF